LFLSDRERASAMSFDIKQFYLSAEGRVNRSQWWLRLILAFLAGTQNRFGGPVMD